MKTMKGNILYSTLKSASFNVIFQVIVKGITFILNALILRFVTQEVVGVMNVRLLLLESTILFLSREAFRRAALSQRELCSWQQIINLLWLMLPLAIFISIVFSWIWLHFLQVPPPNVTQYYEIGVWSISLSCLIEILAEPPYIVAQAYLFIKLKIVLASLVVLLRSLIFIPWVIYSPKEAVIAFSVAQILANIAYSLSYYSFFYYYMKQKRKVSQSCDTQLLHSCSKVPVDQHQMPLRAEHLQQENFEICNDDFPFSSVSDFLPKISINQKWIHPNSAYLTWSFLKQGILKQILTEGERYIMTLFDVLSFKDQGIYDVINNLGSLIVRFLFRPVEDALYFYFTQMVNRDSSIKHQNQKNMEEVAKVLHQSLNCILDIGLLVLTFGQSYAALLLYLYGGKALASGQGPALLRAHSFSVILLGINGITECYTFSTMSVKQLNRYNYLMAVFSVLFLLVSWILTKPLGGLGFILANCCNMLARIIYSIIFIKEKYAGTQMQPLSGLIPTKYYFASLCITFIVTNTSEIYCNNVQHFSIGLICFIFVTVMWSSERHDIIQLVLKKWQLTKNNKDV